MNEHSFSIYNTLDFTLESESIMNELINVLYEFHDGLTAIYHHDEYMKTKQQYGNTETLVELSSCESILNTVYTNVKKVVKWIIQKIREIYECICKYLKLFKRRARPQLNLVTGISDLEKILQSIPDESILIPFNLDNILTKLSIVSDYYVDYTSQDAYRTHADFERAVYRLNESLREISPKVDTLKHLYVTIYNASSVQGASVEYLETAERVYSEFLSKVSEDNTPDEVLQLYLDIRGGYRNLPNIIPSDNPVDNVTRIVDLLKDYMLFTKHVNACLEVFLNRASELYYRGGIQIHLRYPFDQDFAKDLQSLYNMKVDISYLYVTSKSGISWNRIDGRKISNPIMAWCYTDQSIYTVSVYINIHHFLSLDRGWFNILRVVKCVGIEESILANIVHEGRHLCDAQNHMPFDDKTTKDHDERIHEQRANESVGLYLKSHMKESHKRWVRSIINDVKRQIQRSVK